ncbi:MAG: hypothetical protein SFY32_05495 [Bacteroidota bacterium]|nr:hypothetical protein [Bacteroidota bacterium]
MCKRIRNVLIISFISLQIFGQGNIQSPYAQFGLGLVEPTGNIRTMAMGYVGVAQTNTLQINGVNPALTAYSRTYVIYEAGAYGQMSWMASKSQGLYLIGGSFQYLNLLFPIGVKNWTLSLGLAPYSNANAKYKTFYQASNSNLVSERNIIDGVLNQVYLSNAIKLPYGLSLGLTTAFIFGSINRQKLIYPENIGSGIIPQVSSNEQYRVMEFKPGIAWNRPINQKYDFGFGATYTFSTDISSVRQLTNNVWQYNGSGDIVLQPVYLYSDTFSLPTKPVVLPSQLKIGASMSNSSKWNISVDYTFTNYSNYNDLSFTNNIYKNSNKLNIGGEWIPKYDALRGIYKRTTYRAGGYIYQTPFEFNNTRIMEYAGTFGIGLPLGKLGLSSINLGLMYGIRGTMDNDLIEEKFFRLAIGMNLNDRWFLKYRMD